MKCRRAVNRRNPADIHRIYMNRSTYAQFDTYGLAHIICITVVSLLFFFFIIIIFFFLLFFFTFFFLLVSLF